MEYPLISEYREAILSAEDNFDELASFRPVLDSHGDPVMSSGNFAVVFKMRDENDGKLYAVKCFIKDQQGRDESYRKIADELEIVSSSYILPLRYLDNELFVDSAQCDREEFPVVVMEWVEGETLDAYLNRNLSDKYKLEMLSYRFNRMAAWLLTQPFAHGDLKPDNILVRKDGSLVLVDYDGMFVPSMKGEKAREIGSPDYRHPSRTDEDFDEHIDDFSIAVIAISLKAISLNPELKPSSSDLLLLNEKDLCSPNESSILTSIMRLTIDSEMSVLWGVFYIALAQNSLDPLFFRFFITSKPKQSIEVKNKQTMDNLNTSCADQDIINGTEDAHRVVYSRDGKRLLECKSASLTNYTIKNGTIVICDKSFWWCCSLQSLIIPKSVISIGNRAFYLCKSLHNITIPKSVKSIGEEAFYGCESLQSLIIPESVKTIGNHTFLGCKSLQSIVIPEHLSSNIQIPSKCKVTVLST
ncbi:MAG: leucine-rich repeat protein [Muribaculaceae bacterium]|nr:leucine-rich repeat protein [Muribaculaceae bacterium]